MKSRQRKNTWAPHPSNPLSSSLPILLSSLLFSSLFPLSSLPSFFSSLLSSPPLSSLFPLFPPLLISVLSFLSSLLSSSLFPPSSLPSSPHLSALFPYFPPILISLLCFLTSLLSSSLCSVSSLPSFLPLSSLFPHFPPLLISLLCFFTSLLSSSLCSVSLLPSYPHLSALFPHFPPLFISLLSFLTSLLSSSPSSLPSLNLIYQEDMLKVYPSIQFVLVTSPPPSLPRPSLFRVSLPHFCLIRPPPSSIIISKCFILPRTTPIALVLTRRPAIINMVASHLSSFPCSSTILMPVYLSACFMSALQSINKWTTECFHLLIKHWWLAKLATPSGSNEPQKLPPPRPFHLQNICLLFLFKKKHNNCLTACSIPFSTMFLWTLFTIYTLDIRLTVYTVQNKLLW